MPRVLIALAMLSSWLAAPAAADDQPGEIQADAAITAEQARFFETKIRPVLVDRCFDCHSGDEPESGLSLESRAGLLRGGTLGAAVLPGRPAESLLIRALRHDEFLKMPPKEKLPSRHVVDFTKWVEMGAPWPNSKPVTAAAAAAPDPEPGQQFTPEQLRHWAFQPVADPGPPAVESSWPQSPIDQFILARLRAAQLEPAPPADKRTLIRRATFDLTGLPPTPAEVSDFLQDTSPNAFAKVVDRLLASPRYGERWGRHWLDVARYADSNGLDENLAYANAFRYRDYVIAALNDDKPFARFAQEQIAGDLLPASDDERDNLDRFVATGFLAIGPKMLAEDDGVKMQMDIIDEQLNTLGGAFMAMTIGCARCHDHKFDPLPTEDYYSLAGIFKSSKTMENHQVVAVWYERPLVSRAVADEIERVDKQLADAARRIAELEEDCRQQIARRLQSEFGRHLLAAAACRRFEERSEAQRQALPQSESPYPVRGGFALIEAEAYHRGNVELVSGYGDGIGVVATRRPGFVEYDLDVDRTGKYELEIRHAAAASRPLQLIVNGREVESSVAGQVTGSWHPDGQRWFPAGAFELQAGANTLKFDSTQVYPHLDRLALVYRGPEPWPFEAEPPESLARIAARYDVDLELTAIWQEFLQKVEGDKLNEFPSFQTWLAFARLDDSRFAEGAAKLLQQLASPEGLGATTPELLRQRLLRTQPRSLEDVCRVYQQLLDAVQQPEGDNTLKKEWLDSPSPLAGPADIPASLVSRQLQELAAQRDQLESSRPTYDVAMGVTEGEAEDLRVHLRGSHLTLGKVAPRRFPQVLAGADQPELSKQESGRLQLAEWLTREDHPLFGRVIVNRVWHWRFGRGLSPTVDNFGLLGQAPTHPQLLDWLTRRFLDSGGSLKQLHRMMMLSSTYQMSSRFDRLAHDADPENAWLWRFRRRRLEAEEIRDSLIALGSGLDLQMGGSLLKVKNRDYVTVSGTNLTDEYDNLRRSVYLPVVRSAVNDMLQAFDFPDPAVAAGRRQTSTVAPQALMMMNSRLAEQQTLAFAKRLLLLPSDQQRIAAAFESVLSRQPSAQECSAGRQFVQNAQRTASLAELKPSEAELRAWQSYCRVLLSLNEFVYVE